MALKGIGASQGKPKVGKDYTAHLQTKPVLGAVMTSKAQAGEVLAQSVGEDQVLHQGVFMDGTSITVEGGRVINLGNYETARIGVTITVPCTKDSVEETYEYATKWVSDKIEEAIKSAKE